EIFDRFRRGEVNVIVTTRVLDEGIDVPDADVAIIVSGSGSRRQMAQRVGRVVRGAPGKVADVYEIVTRGTVEERLSRARRRGIPFLRREGFYRS
ncbi:MAG: helicase-related protein, partial [Candidatus Korarchaeum sp.]